MEWRGTWAFKQTDFPHLFYNADTHDEMTGTNLDGQFKRNGSHRENKLPGLWKAWTISFRL